MRQREGHVRRKAIAVFLVITAVLVVTPFWVSDKTKPGGTEMKDAPQYKVNVKYRPVDPNAAVLPENVDWSAEKHALMAQDHFVQAWRDAARAMIIACEPESDTGRLMPILNSLQTMSELEAQSPITITAQGIRGIPPGCTLVAVLPPTGYFAGGENFQRVGGIGTGEFRPKLNMLLLNRQADLGRLSRAGTLVHELYHVYESRFGLHRTGSPGTALQSEMYANRAAWAGFQALSRGMYAQRHNALIAKIQRGGQSEPSPADLVEIEQDFPLDWQDGRAADRKIMHSLYSHLCDLFLGFDGRTPLDSLGIYFSRQSAVSSFQVNDSNLVQGVMVQGLILRYEAQNLFVQGKRRESAEAFARALEMDPLFKTQAQMRFDFVFLGLQKLGAAATPTQILPLDALSNRWLTEEPYNHKAHQSRIVCLGMLNRLEDVETSLRRARTLFPAQAAVWDQLETVLRSHRGANR